MDYVVAGFGIGAILALIGFALWELFGNVEDPGRGWLSRAAIGLMLGSLVIWAVTGVSLISHIDDSTGSRLVLLTSLVTIVSVAVGTFWYWRADKAHAAANPAPARVSPRREVAAAAVAARPISSDVELTEWDSWPERDADKPAGSSIAGTGAAPAVSFEAEVAAEAVADSAPRSGESSSDASDSLSSADGVKGGDVAADKSSLANTSASPQPSNIRPFRLAPASLPAEPAVAEDVLIAETVESESDGSIVAEAVEIDAVEVIEDSADSAPLIEAEVDAIEVDQIVVEPQQPAAVVQPSTPDPPAPETNGSIAPATFESSLLADIDGSLSDEANGGYRSPLLSDLGSDQLEGVGLAKWRPDARLTPDDEEEVAPPAKRTRGR